MHQDKVPKVTSSVADLSAPDPLSAVLNLPKSATTAQIRDRYRQLAILFHPDKQPSTSTLFNGSVPQAGSSSSSSSSFLPDGSSTADAEDHRHPYEIDARPVRRTRKEAAESQFAEIQRAYEVLIDPQRRAVYDLLGEEGLKTNWEVGKRGQSPEEIKRQFQRQAYEKRLASIESMVKSKVRLIYQRKKGTFTEVALGSYPMLTRRTSRLPLQEVLRRPIRCPSRPFVTTATTPRRSTVDEARVLHVAQRTYASRLGRSNAFAEWSGRGECRRYGEASVWTKGVDGSRVERVESEGRDGESDGHIYRG